MNSSLRKINSGSGRVCPANFCGYSRVHFRINPTTGLISTAVASQPSRIASSGIARHQRMDRVPWELALHTPFESHHETTSAFLRFLFHDPVQNAAFGFLLHALDDLTIGIFFRSIFLTTLPAIFSHSSRRPLRRSRVRHSSVAISAARQAASGRRAGQR